MPEHLRHLAFQIYELMKKFCMAVCEFKKLKEGNVKEEAEAFLSELLDKQNLSEYFPELKINSY